ncbi:MAG TPA: peptidase domain-containing ABC transporter [Bacteroides graminisolvens]|nr:peptidase domain-containing ABC transporter [Bacteroides graminisolvens]
MRKKFNQYIYLQHDRSDCGIACLMMILRYHNMNRSFEELRYLSGTTNDGTTLLGLYQCANKIGFIAEGCQGNIKELEKSSNPIILNVHIDNLLHYIVFFYYDRKNAKYIIGDPAQGIKKLSEEELSTIWQEGYCLTIIPDKNQKEIYTLNKYKKNKLHFLFQLITEDKKILLHGLFFSVIISILGLSSSVYSQQLVDHILPSQNSSKIVWSIVILGILLTIRVLIVYIKDTLFNYQSKSFNNRIANYFYDKLLYLPKLFFNTRKVGDLVARLNDTTKIQTVIYLFFNNYINDLLTIFTAVILIFFYSPEIGIITLCFIPTLAYLIIRKSKNIIQNQQDIQIYYALTEANYISTITGISDIKNHNKEAFFSKYNSSLFEAYQTKKFSLACIYAKLSATINIIAIAFLITTISTSIYLIKRNNLSIGELIALLSVSGLIISATSNLSLLFIPLAEARISFERMYNLINIRRNKSEIDNGINFINTIKAENISYKYPGQAKSLYDKSGLTLDKGTITALTGDCGSGKTTLIDILLGNYTVDKGTISYNNIDIKEINNIYIRDKIRVVPQNIHIFNGSILFNIAMEANLNTEKLDLVFKKLNIHSFFNSFPQHINTIVGEEGISLSGGQKQIIGLLRALYDEPQVLILDEPTASLDEKHTRIIHELLEKIKPNHITLLISHNIAPFNDIIDKRYKIENAHITEIFQ